MALVSSLRPPWSDKLKSVLFDDLTPIDLWQVASYVTTFGIVGCASCQQVEIEYLNFISFQGVQVQNPSRSLILQFDDCTPPQLPRGTTIGVANCLVSSTEPMVVSLTRSSKLWFIPEFLPDFEWHSCNLFSGAFEGWMKAIEWCHKQHFFHIRQSISVDCDPDVMQIWSLQNQCEFHTAPIPCDDIPSGDKLGLCLPIHEFSWANWCRFPVNLFFTASPPCQPWSLSGTSAGIESDNGFAFIHCLHSIKMVRPIFAALECADAIQQHQHYRTIKTLMDMIGYSLIWSTISKYDDLTPMRRSRWLAVWMRSDVKVTYPSYLGKIAGVHRFSWDHPMYRCVVPEYFHHQLVLSRHLIGIYGSFDFLPKAKRNKLGANHSVKEVLSSRILSPDEIMPTLCAMYTQQHVLASSHLAKKGIFAPLIRKDDMFAFIDPVRFLALLGMPIGSVSALPSKVDVAFHQLGNSVSVPQALCCILVAFDSILRFEIDIESIIKKCWSERVCSSNLFFIVFKDAFLFLTPQDLSSKIDFSCGFEFEGDGIRCDILGTCTSLVVDPNWTISKFCLACGLHDIVRQGFECYIDGMKGSWDSLFHEIEGSQVTIAFNGTHLLNVCVLISATQEWTQIDDSILLAHVRQVESIGIERICDSPPDITDITSGALFDRCFAFAGGSKEPFVFLCPKNADFSVVQNLICTQASVPFNSTSLTWHECKSHPFINVDRVFVGGNCASSPGACVLITNNGNFHSCCLLEQLIPINIAKDLNLTCFAIKKNDQHIARFTLQTFDDSDWIDFATDTTLPSAEVIQSAIDLRFSHFGTTGVALATDEMAFILRLIRAEVSDTHIGLLVDTGADEVKQVLDNIRIVVRSISSLFESGHKRVFIPILIPGHWCAIEASLQIDYSINFVAVGFPQDIVHDVIQFAKICLFAVSNVIHTFMLPLCGFDGLCGWMIVKRWFKRLDLSLPFEFCQIALDQKHISLLDSSLPVDLMPSCHITCELVKFARLIRSAFILNLVIFEPSAALRQKDPPWGRTLQDDDTEMPSPKSKVPQSQVKPEDPWVNFDPWKTGSSTRSCKWEDLKLPTDHPFVDAAGTSIPQVHRHKLNSNVSGVSFVTRSVVADMIKLKPQKPSALIIPASDKTLGNIQPPPKIEGPFEIVVEDTSSGAVFKRQVNMIQISPTVRFQLPKPTYSATLADVREIVVEIDSRFASKDIMSALAEKPLETFKAKMIEQFPTAISELTNVYAFRKFNPKGSEEAHWVFQVMCKLPSTKRSAVIERSGLGILTTRDFIPKGQVSEDLTVIPRFWPADRVSHQEAVKATTGLDGFAGLIVSKRGLAARAWVSKIGSLRQALIPNDERIFDLNLHTIPRHTLISTGWPVACRGRQSHQPCSRTSTDSYSLLSESRRYQLASRFSGHPTDPEVRRQIQQWHSRDSPYWRNQ